MKETTPKLPEARLCACVFISVALAVAATVVSCLRLVAVACGLWR